MDILSKEEIIKIVLGRHKGLVINQNWGETGIFYNPENKLKKGIYLLTFKEKDGENDVSSHLNRGGHYRLNLGISKDTFMRLFGNIPARPKAGGVVEMDYDFSQSDTVIPHPIYAWMAWVCVINPSENTFKKLLPLIDEGYKLALDKYNRKKFV